MPARRPSRIKPSVTAAELLAQCPAPLRALLKEIRTVISTAAPSLEERILPGWRAFGYRDPHAGHVCALFPLPGEIKLYFEHGQRLEDPDGLLSGRLKQTSYIVFRTRRDLRMPALRRLVRRALMSRAL
jgi:hypothetical protein